MSESEEKMSDTPLTDSQELIVPSELEGDEQWKYNGQWVYANFARGLERYSDALRANLEAVEKKLHDEISWSSDYRKALERISRQFAAIPNGNFYNADRYDTDNECVIHLWKDGESFDVRIPTTAALEEKEA